MLIWRPDGFDPKFGTETRAPLASTARTEIWAMMLNTFDENILMNGFLACGRKKLNSTSALSSLYDIQTHI